jgi:hypothetical protein
MGCNQHKVVEKKDNLKKEKEKLKRLEKLWHLQLKNQTFNMEEIIVRKLASTIKNKDNGLENARRKNKTCEQKKSKNIMLIVIKHLFKLCLLLLMIMHGMSILAHQCTFLIEGSGLGI